MSERSDFAVAKDALKHYLEKLEELKKDEDIKKGNSMILEDIVKNSDGVSTASKHLDLESPNTFKDYPKIICSALSIYERDLEASKEKLKEKLGNNVHFEFNKMNEEIKQVQEIKKHMKCPEVLDH